MGYQMELIRKTAAEFGGTFLLAFAVFQASLKDGGADSTLLVPGLLSVLIFVFGPISGAHLNPAVTLGVLVSGRNLIKVSEAAFYLAAQVIGALMGAFVHTRLQANSEINIRVNGTYMGAFTSEVIAVLLFVTVILIVATKKNENGERGKNPVTPFIISLSLHFICSAFSRYGPMICNPAVIVAHYSFHRNPSANETIEEGADSQLMKKCIVLIAAELLASVLSAGLFYFFFPSEYGKGRGQTEKDQGSLDEFLIKDGALPRRLDYDTNSSQI